MPEDLAQGFGDLLQTLDDEPALCNVIVHLAGDMAGANPAVNEVRRLRERHPGLFVRELTLYARLDEAELLLRRALAIDENRLSADHPDAAQILNNLAQLLEATNRLADAEPLMRRLLEMLLKFNVATSHELPHLPTALRNHAGLLSQMGRSPEDSRGKARGCLGLRLS